MKIGKYEIVGVIGQGGMSTVYRGRDVQIGRDVAIKLLNSPAAADYLDLTARFLNEARIIGQLQHPSIVTLFDFGTAPDNQTYIAMELIAGQSLEHHRGRLTAEQFGKILLGVAQGLDHAHTRGVIHRDIKPSNLLLTPEGDAKILDFGVAVFSGARDSRITQTGIVVGTIRYLSPEQVSGAAITPAADQFALAVVAFELLTGKNPFGGDTLQESMTAILMQPPADALSLNPTLGGGCAAVLQRALSKKPQDRFPTCSEFVDSLLSALNASAGWRPFLAELSPPPPAVAGKTTGAAPVAVVTDSARTQTRVDLPVTVGISVIKGAAAPADYSFTQAFATAGPFFGSGEAHFQEIKNKLGFYQDQLQQEYEALIKQMRTTYVLWLVSVSVAFLVLLLALALFLFHQTTGGAITTASSAMLYFLQRVFQQREDAYRSAAEAKRSTVEYGNQWALVIQTIQGMEDPKERVLREGRLVEALTDQLRERTKTAAPRRAKRAAVPASN